MTNKSQIKICMVDDHVLLRTALSSLIDSFENCKVIHQYSNGCELVEGIKSGISPDVIILDLNMPVMNGLETAQWLQANAPEIMVLMLTMYDSELSLIRLLQAGVKGFLKKDIHPAELKFAIHSVLETGYYYSNHTTGKIVNLFRQNSPGILTLQKAILADPEITFLQYACTDLTYKEIASKMDLNPRAIDTIRDQLFLKLDVKSRVGLAIIAIRHGIVTL